MSALSGKEKDMSVSARLVWFVLLCVVWWVQAAGRVDILSKYLPYQAKRGQVLACTKYLNIIDRQKTLK